MDFANKTIHIFNRTYSVPEILRILIIVCGYILLRPYLLKLSGKFQEADHAREVDPDEQSSHAASVTGRRRIVEDDESDDEDGGDGGWGQAKRKEQRRRRREERRRREMGEESGDEEIEEFLVE